MCLAERSKLNLRHTSSHQEALVEGDAVVGVEGEVEDFVEGVAEEEAEGDTTTTTEEEGEVGGAGAEVEEAEEGEEVCVAEEEGINQTSPPLAVTGSALTLSKSVPRIKQYVLRDG